MELKDFESVKNCEKCGNRNFHKTIDCESVFLCKRIYIAGEWTPNGTLPEHLNITCSACGYTWNEKCKS